MTEKKQKVWVLLETYPNNDVVGSCVVAVFDSLQKAVNEKRKREDPETVVDVKEMEVW